MRRPLALLFLFFVSLGASAQELLCEVTVNSDQVGQTNQQVFRTLERSINDLVNKSKWTNRVYRENERVSARMFITVTNYQSDRFEANIQIQSSRPIFNTSYQSPIFNYKDDAFNFQYQEFQPLVFNPNSFDSNLVAVISYYVYIILGLDADTFSLEGGNDLYRSAQQIVSQAQSSNYGGWSQQTGQRSRFELVHNLLSNSFKEYRIAMYNYHRKGLDILADNNSTGKQILAGSLRLFEAMVQRRPNAILIQTFFDAKAEEIQNILPDGPPVDLVQLRETLNKVAPFHANTWNAINF